MQKNHLIVTDQDFFVRQNEARVVPVELILPAGDQRTLGMSELCYIRSQDLLLITLTSEATDNAYDDGEIGNSYLGWINKARHKLQGHNVTLDNMLNLAGVDEVFKNEKIEGICAEQITHHELTSSGFR